jgi:hypothetical protein
MVTPVYTVNGSKGMTTSARIKRKMVRRAARMLHPRHPAAEKGTTLFEKRVRGAFDGHRVLIPGANNSKVGNRVSVGRWRGFPIYLLTLEERKTCPRTCHHWLSCYGSNMQYAWRVEHGVALEMRLWKELAELNRYHLNKTYKSRPRGFVVRLHVLGDFYSVDYVRFWSLMLTLFPALHVYGYTAWQYDTDIGKEVLRLRTQFGDRWAIRFSVPKGVRGTMEAVSSSGGLDPDPMRSFQCPAEIRADKLCGNCAACWESRVNVAFRSH